MSSALEKKQTNISVLSVLAPIPVIRDLGRQRGGLSVSASLAHLVFGSALSSGFCCLDEPTG